MNFRRIFTVLFMLSAILCLAPSAPANDEWKKLRSRNFQFYGNAADEDIRQFAVKLETFREIFREFTDRKNFNSPIPVNVIIFKDDASFDDFKISNQKESAGEQSNGFFQTGDDINYIALPVKNNQNLRPIFRRYAEFLIENEIGRTNAPAWFVEGLAEYLELTQIENDGAVKLGAVNDKHLYALRNNKLIPLETFFHLDFFTVTSQSEENQQIFFAQAWALIHFLLNGSKGAGSPQLDKFTALLKTGKPSIESFREAFQTDLSASEQAFADYVNQKNFSEKSLHFAVELQGEPHNLSEAETKTVLGDLLYHINRLGQAEKLLAEALKLDENSGFTYSSFGLIKMRQKNFAEAEKYLEKAVRADEKNYLTHYRYAYTLSREGMSEYGFVSGYDLESAEKMREELKKVVALNPNFAPGYNLFAFINFIRNEKIEEAAEYLKKALSLAPGSERHQIRNAEIFMRREEFTKARRIAQKVFQSAANEEMRIYAQNRIHLINTTEAQLISLKNYKARLNDEISDKLLTDEEFARLREIAILESINKSLRIPQTDEVRILGYLTNIDCGEKGVEFFVKVDKKILKLGSRNFDNLLLVSFAKEMSGVQFGCETIKNEAFAVVTYQPNKNAASRTAGEILSIEFVPQNFKFLK